MVAGKQFSFVIMAHGRLDWSTVFHSAALFHYCVLQLVTTHLINSAATT